MRILATGHCGYIGRHLVPVLQGRGHEVIGVDMAESASCDLTTSLGPILAIRNLPYDAVVHLAAKCVVGDSVLNPLSCWYTNITGTIAMLQLLASPLAPEQYRFRGRFVFASTLLARHPESSPYAASKLAGEHLITAAARTDGFSAVCLRLGNVAGGADTTPSRLIPSACRLIREGLRVPVYSGHATADGTAFRDYVHVLDVADAICCALDAPLGVRETAVMDIGTGSGSGVYGVLRELARVSGKCVVVVEEKPARHGDVAVCVAETLAAERVLGWRAERGLGEMVSEAWKASEE